MAEAQYTNGFIYAVDAIKVKATLSRHYHDTFEIYYLTKGSCTYFINDKCYEVKEGDIVLIPPGVIHNTVYSGMSRTRRLINCSEKYIPTTLRENIGDILYTYRNPLVRPEIDRIFDNIEKEYLQGDSYSKDMLVYLTGELFLLLARNKNSREEISTGLASVERALAYVNGNFTSDITLSDTAEACHMSPEHLSRSFKKETGLGFNEFVNMLRLQKAEYMLKNDKNLSIAEIAFACGFNDSNYFSEKFRREYGYTPSYIRRVKVKMK